MAGWAPVELARLRELTARAAAPPAFDRSLAVALCCNPAATAAQEAHTWLQTGGLRSGKVVVSYTPPIATLPARDTDSLLHIAAADGHPATVAHLCEVLRRAGESVDIRNALGWTPLHAAATRSLGIGEVTAIITTLLEHGADAGAVEYNGLDAAAILQLRCGGDAKVQALVDTLRARAAAACASGGAASTAAPATAAGDSDSTDAVGMRLTRVSLERATAELFPAGGGAAAAAASAGAACDGLSGALPAEDAAELLERMRLGARCSLFKIGNTTEAKDPKRFAATGVLPYARQVEDAEVLNALRNKEARHDTLAEGCHWSRATVDYAGQTALHVAAAWRHPKRLHVVERLLRECVEAGDSVDVRDLVSFVLVGCGATCAP